MDIILQKEQSFYDPLINFMKIITCMVSKKNAIIIVYYSGPPTYVCNYDIIPQGMTDCYVPLPYSCNQNVTPLDIYLIRLGTRHKHL